MRPDQRWQWESLGGESFLVPWDDVRNPTSFETFLLAMLITRPFKVDAVGVPSA